MPNYLPGFLDHTVNVSTQNALQTMGLGHPTSANVLNPTSFAALSNFTSLDGSSILSISNRDYYIDDCVSQGDQLTRPIFASEKHITVIKKGPTMPLQLQMFPYEDGSIGDRAEISYDNQNQLHEFSAHFTNGSYNTDDAIINSSFTGDKMHQSSNWGHKAFPIGGGAPAYFLGSGDLGNFNAGAYWGDPDGDWNTKGTASDGEDISIFYNIDKELVEVGDVINIPIDVTDTGEDWENGDHIIIEHDFLNSFGNRE